MTQQAVKLLEARVLLAVERIRDLAAERQTLASEVERLQGELTAWSDDGNTRKRSAREALRHALAELRED